MIYLFIILILLTIADTWLTLKCVGPNVREKNALIRKLLRIPPLLYAVQILGMGAICLALWFVYGYQPIVGLIATGISIVLRARVVVNNYRIFT